jgi:peptidoglycan/LPS O-acetylase OafA/YrhL
MGLLRLYLAICVISAHSGPIIPWTIHGGEEAVEIFFMISGFYMSLVAPKYNSVWQFYVSRFLRIFIPYWITLGFVIAISIGFGVFGRNWLELNPYLSKPFSNGFMGVIFTTFTNLVIFFQDWVLFLKHDLGGGFAFTSNFRESAHPLYPYMIIPQAWTVSLELYFYLLFPLLNKLKSKALVFILITSLVARIFTYEVLKLNKDPWNYRFFPFEIALFVAGMLCFRIYSVSRLNKTLSPVRNAAIYVLISPVLLVLFICTKHANIIASQYIGMEYARLLLYLLWAFVIPLLFHFLKTSEVDRFIGELSYPVYLIHVIVVTIIRIILDTFNLPTNQLGIFSVVVAVCWSTNFYVFIIKGLDNARSKIVSRRI